MSENPELPEKNDGRCWPTSKAWGRIGAFIASVAALSTVIFGVWNLHEANALQEENNQLQQAALDSHFEEVMMGLDRHFVAYPRLRSFFYSSRSIPAMPPQGLLHDQAMATAELIIDFADDLAAYTKAQKMDTQAAERWTEIVRAYFDGSAAVRTAWAEFHSPYGEITACILGAPFGPDQLEAWDWRSNRPIAPRPRSCE